jgi:hypothetical protein
MVLICSCGWKGVNLVPHPGDNTARCPKCSAVFKGIPANRAIAVSIEEEKEIMRLVM